MPPRENPRLGLLSDFRSMLRQPASEHYIDLDTLIDVLDFALDMEDNYVLAEALMLGERLYPGNDLILERRAFHYLEHDALMAAKFLEDRPELNTPVVRLMRMIMDADVAGKDVLVELKNWAEQVERFSEFDVVAFFKICHMYDYDFYACTIVELIRPKVDYSPTLLWEEIHCLQNLGMSQKQVPLLEKLTEAFPFEPHYWRMLATAALFESNYDTALNAIDYDIALEPGDPQSAIIKSRILFEMERNEEAVDILRKASELPDAPVEIWILLLSLYENIADDKFYRETLRKASKLFPDNIAILTQCLLHLQGSGKNRILAFLRSRGDSVEPIELSGLLQLLFVSEKYDCALALVKAAESMGVDDRFLDKLTVPLAYYYAGEFQQTLSHCSDYIEDFIDEDSNYLEWLRWQALLLAAACRLGNYDQLNEIMQDYREMAFNLCKGSEADSNTFTRIGAKCVIFAISQELLNASKRKNHKIDTDFDPICDSIL